MPTRRNPVVRAGALLRKGGPHVKAPSGKRQRIRGQLDDEVAAYFEDRQNARCNNLADKEKGVEQEDHPFNFSTHSLFIPWCCTNFRVQKLIESCKSSTYLFAGKFIHT